MPQALGRMVLAVLITISAVAQQKNTPKKAVSKPVQSKPGAISGRVFAITEGGDLKPARLAKIYLFHLHTRTAQTPTDSEEALNTAGMAWLTARADEAKKRLEETRRDVREGLDLTDSIRCRREILGEDMALLKTLEWSESAKKGDQILTADADEDGNFKVPTVPPGRYILVARGHAGFNEALWINDSLTVEPGTEITLKLASPKVACSTVK